MSAQFPLATSSWDQDEFAALQRVIDSDQFSMGPEVRAFEDQFARQFGSKHAIMVNSGSSANLLIMAGLRYTKNDAIRIDEGAEIIVPAVSWSTTYYPLQQYGLKLKFVDIDIDTLNYDLAALKDAVSDNTRAIMVVNLLGNPNDFFYSSLEKVLPTPLVNNDVVLYQVLINVDNQAGHLMDGMSTQVFFIEAQAKDVMDPTPAILSGRVSDKNTDWENRLIETARKIEGRFVKV